MYKLLKTLIWICVPILLLIAIYASVNQMPPNPNSYNPGFVEFPIITWMHVLPGLLFMVIAPLQLIKGIRQRFPFFHRWAGRLFVFACLFVGISAILMVIYLPFSRTYEGLEDWQEQAPDIVFGTLFLIYTALGYYHIRRKNIPQHRAYMIRVFAIGLGISLFRIFMAVSFATGGNPLPHIGTFFWIGFMVTYGFGELYLYAESKQKKRARKPRKKTAQVLEAL